MLNAQQQQQFDTDGYLVLERAIAAGELAALRAAAHAIVEGFEPADHPTTFTTKDRDQGRDDYFMRSSEAVHCFVEEDAVDDDGKLLRPKHLAINKIGHALHDRVPEFGRFCRLPVFAQLLQDIGYRAPVLWQSMYIFKQPQIGGEVRWHQDASYLITQPAGVTGIWVAMEDAHRGNGCLWVQPGGHHSPLREIYEVDHVTGATELRTLDNTPWPTAHDAVALEVEAGSVIVFRDYLPHYSSQNTSAASRQAFTLHVAERDALWSDKNWLQRPTLPPFEITA